MKEDVITDAIVPIYCNGEFSGTGFIYKSYLITAAHVVVKSYDEQIEYEKIEYSYRGRLYLINQEEKVCCDWYKGERDEYGHFLTNLEIEDIAIYVIENECNYFTLDDSDINDNCEARLYGFRYFSKDNISLKNGAIKMYNSYYSSADHIDWILDYCFFCDKMDVKFEIIEGFSGGPIINEDKIMGMLFEKIPSETSFRLLKTSRIIEKIDEYEQNKRGKNCS